jgi:uncharacterized lipoprotein YajG
MRKMMAAVAAAVLLAGCAKQQPVTEMSLSPKVMVQVTNNFSPPDQVTVFIVNQTGSRQVLGSVSPGQKKSFPYQPTSAVDKFSLVAQATQGGKMTSQIFTLVNAESVVWDLRSNTLQIMEP